jgi:hypothetical protein
VKRKGAGLKPGLYKALRKRRQDAALQKGEDGARYIVPLQGKEPAGSRRSEREEKNRRAKAAKKQAVTRC